MRSPADMEVIQIEITNACRHSCSNCTRFCGHYRHPFFMDLGTFQDIEKVAVAMAGRILCGVNLKRIFVDGHADHQTVYENRWGY